MIWINFKSKITDMKIYSMDSRSVHTLIVSLGAQSSQAVAASMHWTIACWTPLSTAQSLWAIMKHIFRVQC